MKSILEYVKKIVTVPKESPLVEEWKVKLLWFIRIFVFAVAIATLVSESWEMGIMTLIIAILITAPVLITRGKVKDFPIEIEIMLFVIVFIQYILGEIAALYYKVPYFDKFAHFSMVFLIAAIAYTVIYAMYKTGKFIASKTTIFVLIILISMGIGGIWEIIEYGIDLLRINFFPNWVTFQGSLVEDPYYDTMNDLVMDFAGAICGAIFTLKFITSDINNNSRTQELISDIDREILK